LEGKAVFTIIIYDIYLNSNVAAGRLFGIPIRGTHSHAFVSSFMVSGDFLVFQSCFVNDLNLLSFLGVFFCVVMPLSILETLNIRVPTVLFFVVRFNASLVMYRLVYQVQIVQACFIP
jgi:hypothetical protein